MCQTSILLSSVQEDEDYLTLKVKELNCLEISATSNQKDFFDMTKFTILIPSPLLSWCRLSLRCQFENILCPHSALTSPNWILFGTWENDWKLALIPHKNCLLKHQLSPQLVHAYSKQRYDTSDLSAPYVISVFLSPRHGMSSGCKWRNGLQYWG